MSLINNMLRDLENRATNSNLNNNIHSLKSASHNYRHWPLKQFISIVLLFLLCTLFFLSFYIPKVHMVVHPMSKPSVYSSDFHNDLTQIALTQILLKNISIERNEIDTSLAFELSTESLYYVEYYKSKNELILTLYNTDMTSNIPRVENISAVKNISIFKKNNNAYIHLSLHPDTKILAVDQKQTMNNYLLTLSFLNPPESQLTTSTTQVTQANIGVTSVKKPSNDSEIQSLYLLAVSDAENEKITAATEKLNLILNKDPEYHDARATLVALLLKQNNSQMALQVLNIGLKLNPDHVPFIELKARLLISEDKPKQALVLLTTIFPEISSHTDYYTMLAALYDRLDKNQLAAQTYQQLLKYNIHNANWWIGLGVSLEKLGDKNSAADAYRHALTEDNLNGDTLAYVQNQLNSIEGLE